MNPATTEIYEVHLSAGATMVTFYFRSAPSPAQVIEAIENCERFQQNADLFTRTLARVRQHDYSPIIRTLILND